MAEASNECVQAVATLLTTLAAKGRLSYKFSLVAVSGGPDAFAPRVQATFSKPEPRFPSPAAVARLYFHLSSDRQNVRGFTVESDPHFHVLDGVRWDEAVLDRVVRRKLQLRGEQLVDLSDEFASTRAPAAERIKRTEARERERENTEEALLEQLQRCDAGNDGRLPLVAIREALEAMELSLAPGMPREVLLALASADREGMVEYSEIVGVAAEAVDAMADRADELGDVVDAKRVVNLEEEEEQALDAFELLSARQTRYTEEKLVELLDAHAERRTAAASALAARQSITKLVGPKDESGALEEATEEDAEYEGEEHELPQDEELHDEEEDAGEGENEEHDGPVDENDDEANQHMRRHSLAPQRDRHMTRQQLREILETPQLLLSHAEVNLMLALAEPVADDTAVSSAVEEEVACTGLGTLLRHVRRLIFRFQRRAFRDRTDIYLLHQLRAFESNSLQGSSRHLKQRLTQKETKAVIWDLQKLLLSPYQIMQLAALSEEKPGVPEHLVYYKDCVPPMSRRLHELVDVDRLVEQATLLHNMQGSQCPTMPLPSEVVVQKSSYRCFETFDRMQRGVISITDFQAGLKLLAGTHGLPVDSPWEMKQLGALADPNGSGRVNYALFQHLLYPLILGLQQERELVALQCDARAWQETKEVGTK